MLDAIIVIAQNRRDQALEYARDQALENHHTEDGLWLHWLPSPFIYGLLTAHV